MSNFLQLGFTTFDLPLLLMKIIAFFLSIFVFASAVTPCSDGKTCDEVDNTEMPHHDHSEDENDDCSPFCVCTCCGSTFLDSKITITPFLAAAHFFKFDFHFSVLYAFSYEAKVWHPPALV